MSGHGHVRPNPNGSVARCGGAALCVKCAAEYLEVHGINYEARAAHMPVPVDTVSTLRARVAELGMFAIANPRSKP